METSIKRMKFHYQYGYNEIRTFKGISWLKVFYHNMENLNGYTNESEAQSCQSDEKFSILNEINDKFKINNCYEFLLYFTERQQYNQWRQNNNPLDEIEDGQDKAGGFYET